MLLTDVKHQQHAQKMLQSAVLSDRVHHAYIFHGPDGVGKETLATLLGENRTMRLLKTVQIFSISFLFLSAVFGLISSLGFALLICPVLLFFVLIAYERGYVLPGIRLEFLIETLFPLAGIVAFVWSIFMSA